MKTKLHVLLALTGAYLTTGCIIVPGPILLEPPYPPGPPPAFFLPDVIVFENGIRHDREFYRRHPDAYQRDRMKYPDRFGPAPHGRPPGPSQMAPAPGGPKPPGMQPGGPKPPGAPGQPPPVDPKLKKKKPDQDDRR